MTKIWVPILLLAGFTPIASAQELASPSALPEAYDVSDSAPKAGGESIAGEADANDRLTVPVRIGDGAPLRFLIDTASQRTLLSDRTAHVAALEVEDRVTIITLTGSTSVETVYVPELSLGSKSYSGLIAPTFDHGNLGADGVLGLDSLQGQRIVLDFGENRIEVEDVRTKLLERDTNEIVVSARRRSGQLIFAEATLAGFPVNVIIDTGGQLSIGNRALQRKLGLSDARLIPTNLVDVTGRTTQALVGRVDDLRIRKARFRHLPIAFADIPPFRALNLHRKPTLFLGMDALRQFDRVGIDFANRKLYFRLPEGA